MLFRSTSATGWRYTFSNLPVDDGYGHVFEYEIREEGVPGYFNRIEGYDIINTLLGGGTGEDIQPSGDEDGEDRTTTTHDHVAESRNTGTDSPIQALNEMNDEELEGMFVDFGYGVPLWGMLMGTGDDTPAWPWVFAGIGAIALALIPILGYRRKKRRA